MFTCTNSLCFSPALEWLFWVICLAGLWERPWMWAAYQPVRVTQTHPHIHTPSHWYKSTYIKRHSYTQHTPHAHKCICIMLFLHCGCNFDTCPFDEVTEGEFKADPQAQEPIPDPMWTVVTEWRAAYMFFNFTLLQHCLNLNSPYLAIHKHLSVPPNGGVLIRPWLCLVVFCYTRAYCFIYLPL